MGAREWEIGLGVIKGEVDPLRRLMATSTVLCELPLMHIDLDVTLSTELQGPHPLTFDMACFAFNVLMTANQLETGKLVREERLSP